MDKLNMVSDRFQILYDKSNILSVFNFNKQKIFSTFYNINNVDLIDFDKLQYFITTKSVVIYEKNIYQKHICLFYDQDWFVFFSDNQITKLSSTQIINKMFQNFDDLDTNICYFFIVEHNDFFTMGLSELSIENIYYLYSTHKYMGDIIHSNPTTFPRPIVIDNIEKKPNKKKIIHTTGYVIESYNSESNTYKYYEHNLDEYNYILSIYPSYHNKYLCYLELYQKNLLKNIIHQIHSYYYDIIKMINSSLKTISKEILNIYFLTRKKQNDILYSNLTPNYKKIIYDLHHIYIEKKYNKPNVSKLKSLDDFKLSSKITISIDIVYKYLKTISALELKNIFDSRKLIMNKIIEINKNIFYPEQTDILVFTELLGS